jgi:ubiquinone/menaquinone biosynthesis C-methylase UbiE
MPDISPDIYDPAYVKDVFDKCSAHYIMMSFIFSFGFTERWRNQCVKALEITSSSQRLRGYDLMAGTGEAWPHLFALVPNVEELIAVDISSGMHKLAMERLHKSRDDRIAFIEDDVFNSKIEPASADFVISTFGLKTFDSTQHQRFAQLVSRILKPGGSFSMVEASDPVGWVLRPVYNFYLNRVLPLVEKALLNGAQDFSNIGQYTAKFSNASAFGELLTAQGLEVRYDRLFFGCASRVSGHKPLSRDAYRFLEKETL